MAQAPLLHLCQACVGWVITPTSVQMQRQSRMTFTWRERQENKLAIETPAAADNVPEATADLPCASEKTGHEVVVLQKRLFRGTEPNDLRDLRNITVHLHAPTLAIQVLAFP